MTSTSVRRSSPVTGDPDEAHAHLRTVYADHLRARYGCTPSATAGR